MRLSLHEATAWNRNHKATVNTAWRVFRMTTTKSSAYLLCFFCNFLVHLVLLLTLAPMSRADNRVVTVGIYENEPKVFTSNTGIPAGILIDIIEHIAKDEGWNLHYLSGTWGGGIGPPG